MNNRQILDYAPEGAMHIEEITNTYVKTLPSASCKFFNDWYISDGNEWVLDNSYNILLTRSLADIQKLVEKDERIEELEAEIRKLRNGNDIYFDPSTIDL